MVKVNFYIGARYNGSITLYTFIPELLDHLRQHKEEFESRSPEHRTEIIDRPYRQERAKNYL